MRDDLISRQAAIDVLNKEIIKRRLLDDVNDGMLDEFDTEDILRKLPSAQPEITDEQAIGHLQASGWMQSHDKQMYEMGLKEGLADDSDSYDALLPSSQPEINSSEISNRSDFVSRKAVRDMVATWTYDLMEQEDLWMALHDVDELSPVQDFHIDFADLRAEQEERNIATPILNPNGNIE